MGNKLVGYHYSSTKLLTNTLTGYVNRVTQPAPTGYAPIATRDTVMARSVRHVLLLRLLTTSLVVGCKNSAPTRPVANDVAAARVRWQRSAITRYVFTSSLTCFCASENTAAMRVIGSPWHRPVPVIHTLPAAEPRCA